MVSWVPIFTFHTSVAAKPLPAKSILTLANVIAVRPSAVRAVVVRVTVATAATLFSRPAAAVPELPRSTNPALVFRMNKVGPAGLVVSTVMLVLTGLVAVTLLNPLMRLAASSASIKYLNAPATSASVSTSTLLTLLSMVTL